MPGICMSLSSTTSRAADAAIRFGVPVATIGGLPIAVIDRTASARRMLDLAIARRGTGARALVVTSANGQVLSMCARDQRIRDLFLDADDMPLVFASRLLCRTPLPERVATTDFFHDVARIAPARGATFYLLGATKTVIEQAARRAQTLYPDLK